MRWFILLLLFYGIFGAVLFWFYLLVPEPVFTIHGPSTKISVIYLVVAVVALINFFIPVGYYRYKKALERNEEIIPYRWTGSHGFIYSVNILREDYMLAVSSEIIAINSVPLGFLIYYGVVTIYDLNPYGIGLMFLLIPIAIGLATFAGTLYYCSKRAKKGKADINSHNAKKGCGFPRQNSRNEGAEEYSVLNTSSHF